jgi:hypothetical protein
VLPIGQVHGTSYNVQSKELTAHSHAIQFHSWIQIFGESNSDNEQCSCARTSLNADTAAPGRAISKVVHLKLDSYGYAELVQQAIYLYNGLDDLAEWLDAGPCGFCLGVTRQHLWHRAATDRLESLCRLQMQRDNYRRVAICRYYLQDH